MTLLKTFINKLEHTGISPNDNKPHKLSGKYSDYWEAHLKPDWLIIWKVFINDNEIWLTPCNSYIRQNNL